MRRYVYLTVITVFAIGILISVFPELPARASAESIWQDNIVLKSDEPWADEDISYMQCERGDMSVKTYYENKNAKRDDVAAKIDQAFYAGLRTKEVCITQNKQGLFGGDLWSADGNPANAVEVENVHMLPAPAGEVVVFNSYSGADPYGSFRSSINHNFRYIGDTKTKSRGSGLSLRLNKTWRLRTQADILRYSNNDPLLIRRWAFSTNGKYAVVALTTGVLVRINLDTQELQPFAQMNSGVRNWTLAISNDGDYVLSRGTNSNSDLTLHELVGCQDEYSKGDMAKNPDISGCSSRSIHSMITGIHPEVSGGSIGKMIFEPNSAGFTVGAGWRTSEGYKWRKLKFISENYTSRAQGYLAMGDSFSSGEGDTEGGTWYEPGTDEQGDVDTFLGRNLCHLSRRSYPYLIAIQLGYLANNTSSPPADGLFHSVACSGALAKNIVGGSINGQVDFDGNEDVFKDSDNQYRGDYFEDLNNWQPGRIKQLDFINANVFGGYTQNELSPEAITLGIGGNDAGFGEIIAACASAGTCDQAIPRTTATASLALTISALKPKLTGTYKQIKTANPEARIYVHGYPIFVKGYDGNCGNNVHLDSRETALVEEGVKYMNAVVESAAREAGVFYVDVTNILEGVNLCSSTGDEDMAVNGATAGDDIGTPWYADILSGGICFARTGCLGNESYHPNPKAHVLYRNAIIAQTENLTKEMPDPQKTNFPLPDVIFFGVWAHGAVSSFNGVGTTMDIVIPEPKPFLTTSQNTLGILQEGLLPGSQLVVSVHSEPIVIGEYTVDSTGVIGVTITLPEDLEPGSHQIHITGIDAFGNEIDYYEVIILGESTTDFDGDGVLNEEDSCPVIPNAFIDEDEDGIDDACDTLLVTNVQAVEEQLTKGEPNPETVAGTGEELAPKVLGSTTEVLGETLQTTGYGANTYIIVGLSLVSVDLLISRRRRTSFKLRKD